MRRSPLIDFGAGNAPIVNDINGNISWEPEKGATLKRNVQLDQLKLFMKQGKFDLVYALLGLCFIKLNFYKLFSRHKTGNPR